MDKERVWGEYIKEEWRSKRSKKRRKKSERKKWRRWADSVNQNYTFIIMNFMYNL